eukprot:403330958
MQMTLLNPSLFLYSIDDKPSNQNPENQLNLGQIDSTDHQIINTFSNFFNTTLSSLLVTRLTTQILISQSLQLFWSFVNTQQLISHMPLLEITVPPNLYYFFLLVVGSLKFDYLFSEFLIEELFGVKDNEVAYNDTFRNFGYDSSLFISNLGFTTFLLFLSSIFVGIAIVIQLISLLLVKLQRLASILNQYSMVSFPIRLFIECYLNLYLSAMINMYTLNFRKNGGESFSSLMAIIFFIVCSVAPLFLAFKGCKMSVEEIKDNRYLKPFFEELKLNQVISKMYYVLYFLRRIVFVMSMMYFHDYAYLQIIIFQMMSLFQLIYLIHIRPFEIDRINQLEVINETLVLFVGVFSLMFTDIDCDPDVKYNIGWVVLALVRISKKAFRMAKRFNRKYIRKNTSTIRTMPSNIDEFNTHQDGNNSTLAPLNILSRSIFGSSTTTGFTFEIPTNTNNFSPPQSSVRLGRLKQESMVGSLDLSLKRKKEEDKNNKNSIVKIKPMLPQQTAIQRLDQLIYEHDNLESKLPRNKKQQNCECRFLSKQQFLELFNCKPSQIQAKVFNKSKLIFGVYIKYKYPQ